jgi:Ras GTPase-activating-like protein IQGAP2/3
MSLVTEDDEIMWEDVLEAEIETEMCQIPRLQPSVAVGDSAYRLEDIRSWVY